MKWHAVIDERKETGEKHLWNVDLDAFTALDAVEQALSGYEPEDVYGVEVERV